MVQMKRAGLILLLVSAMFADAPPTGQKAPPEVDTALRARITEFFQLQSKGKFVQATKMVADDSKDFFIGGSKSAYINFEVKNIKYSDNFTKAIAMVQVERMVPVEGFLGHPLTWPVPTRWKLENGEWCWYMDPDDLRRTPFGISMPKGSVVFGPPPPGSKPTGAAPAAPAGTAPSAPAGETQK